MFCPKCGNELKPGTKFCNKCGAPLEVSPSREQIRPETGRIPPKGDGKKKGKGCLIVLIVALFLAVLLGIGGFAGYKLGLFDGLLNQKTEETTAGQDEEDKKSSKNRDEEDEDEDSEDKKDKKGRDKKDSDEDMTEDNTEEEEKSEAATTQAQERIKLSELLGETTAAAAETVWAETTTAAAESQSPPGSEGTSELTAGTSGGDGSYILPDSSSRRLTEEDLAGLTKDQLKIARNEIYARHGRMFDSEVLQFYFNSKSWYRGTISPSAFSEDLLSQVEKDNVQLIIKKEESMP